MHLHNADFYSTRLILNKLTRNSKHIDDHWCVRLYGFFLTSLVLGKFYYQVDVSVDDFFSSRVMLYTWLTLKANIIWGSIAKIHSFFQFPTLFLLPQVLWRVTPDDLKICSPLSCTTFHPDLLLGRFVKIIYFCLVFVVLFVWASFFYYWIRCLMSF